MNGRNPLEIHFRIGPIPVVIEPGFWIMTAILGLSGGFDWGALIWVVVVLFSVLAHELGHALMALGLGTRASIRLYAFGGLTFPEKRLGRVRDIAISLAGPFAGFLVGALVLVASRAHPPASPLGAVAVDQLVYVNIFWGLFNLLPVVPLDGGHVLLGILGAARQRAVVLIGGIVATVIAIGFGMVSAIYAAMLFAMLAFRNLQAWWQLGRAPPPGQAGAQPTPMTVEDALKAGWEALRKGEEEQALAIGKAVLDQTPDPDSRNHARDLLAWVAMARAEYREALRQLERSEPPMAARALTWAMVLEALGDHDHAAPYALRAVEVEPSETAASLAVKVLAKAGKVADALAVAQRFEWSRPAQKEGALAEVAFAQGAFADAAVHYGAAFELSGVAADAYNAACSLARAGARAEALGFIARALKAGLDDPEQIRSDPDFASLKGEPELERLLASVPRA